MIIKSEDTNAVEKLKKKLVQLEKYREEMKRQNTYYATHGTMVGYENMPVAHAQTMDALLKYPRHPWENKPYSDYDLRNNYQSIQYTKKRIEELEKERQREAVEYDTEGLDFHIVENKDLARLQIFFDQEPSDEIKALMKHKYGFRYAPSQNAYQRLNNDNARRYLNYFVRKMRAMQEERETAREM